MVGKVGVPVVLPPVLDDRAAIHLQLPPFVPVALYAAAGLRWHCSASELLAWRLVGRSRVELHGLPETLASCLADWLRRTAAGDLVGDLSGVA